EPEAEEADDEPEAEEANDEPEAEEADDELEVEEAGVEPEAEGADVELEAEEPDGVPKATIGTGSQRPFAGDQTPPPRDESSDSNSEPEAEEADDEPKAEDADDELEVEEAGVEPEAEGADVELEAEEPDGESSTARDPQFLGGLAPWALRRDLEALRRQERIMEAESEMSRTEVALLGSEAKIGKMEREILHHDLSSVEETFGKVVEKLKVKKWMTEEFCPRSVIQRMEQELYNLMMKGMDIDRYTNRFHELALLCPRMVEPEAVK
nr:hypothetical protein [Tanacetum cinerariifolium]